MDGSHNVEWKKPYTGVHDILFHFSKVQNYVKFILSVIIMIAEVKVATTRSEHERVFWYVVNILGFLKSGLWL